MREVYLDSLLIANVLSDYFLLRLSGKVMGENMSRRRIVGAAVLGGVYSCVIFFRPVYGLLAMTIHLLILSLLCMIAFKPKGIQRVIKLTAVTFLCAAALGGAMAGISYLLEGDILRQSGVFYLEIPPERLAFLFVVIYAFVRLCMRICLRIKKGFEEHVCLHIKLGEKNFSAEALIDTGNRLKDPITGKKVIVCDPHVFRDYSFEQLVSEHPAAVRILPIVTATGEGSLKAFRPDAVWVEQKKPRYDLLVAIADGAMGGDYNAVAGCELLEGEFS